MLNRKVYGFEIKKDFYISAKKWIDETKQIKEDIKNFGFAKTQLEKNQPTLWT